MIRKRGGFTLVEMLVIVMVFGVLLSGMLSMLSTSARTLKSMEDSLGAKSQYQRAVSFITNTIRRNQQSNMIQISSDKKRMAVKLEDYPGHYLHYYQENEELLMYVGLEADAPPLMSDVEKKKNTMILAKDVVDLSFELEYSPDTEKNNLRVTYRVIDRSKNEAPGGVPETISRVDRINMYITN